MNHRRKLVIALGAGALAAKRQLPTIAAIWEYVEAGGLMSYGPNVAALFRRAATYVDKIFKGAKPGDLPVEQPTKFEMFINGKTAKALGLKIPQSLLILADKVIEGVQISSHLHRPAPDRKSRLRPNAGRRAFQRISFESYYSI